MPLSGKIPKSVQDMFSDPVDYFKKQVKPCIQIFEFHKCHQRRLYRHLGQKLKVLETNIGEAKKLVTQAKQIEREFRRLKTENEYLKNLISKKDSYPRSSPVQRHKSPSSGNFMSPNYYADSPDKSYSRRGPSPGHHMNREPSPGHHMNREPSQHIKMNNSFNGRLLVRSPPEGGKLGSVHDFQMTPENRRLLTTPDSGYSGAGTPLTVPRPILFHGSQD